MINNPTELSACVIWLDGSNSTYLKSLSTGSGDVSNGSAVGYWQNLGSLSSVGHFTNIGGGDTTRPTYISSLSCLRFDGSNDYLTLSATQTYTAQTVFVVTAPRTYLDTARIYSQASSGAADNATFLPLQQSGTAASLGVGSWAASFIRSVTSHRALSTFDTFTSWHSGGGIINFRNGESATSFAHTLGSFSVLRHRIGGAISSTGTASTYYTGDISEVIVYNRALTNAEREDVEYYLSRKWSVLNSIPRQVYALKSGNWSDSTLWSVSADPVPWNFPLSADNVYTNTFTITADSPTRVDTIRNSTLAPNIASGGSFVLANGVSLSAVIPLDNYPVTLLTLTPNATSTFVGNINGPTTVNTTRTVWVSAGSNLAVFGNVLNGTIQNFQQNGSTIYNAGTLNVYGNLASLNGFQVNNVNSVILRNEGICNIVGSLSGTNYGNFVNIGAIIQTLSTSITNLTGNIFSNYQGFGCGTFSLYSGTLNVIGDVFCLPSFSVGANGVIFVPATSGPRYINVIGKIGNLGICSSTGSPGNPTTFITVKGNVISDGLGGAIVNNNSTFFVNLTGDVVSNNAGVGIGGTSTTSVSVFGGNIINAPNGRQAIYAPRYQVFPTGSAQYTRQAVNGYDSYVDYWTSNSTFSYPASSDVAVGTTYSNSTLSGSMAVPSPSSVALGALVGNTAGTASITLDNFWNTSTTSLATANSIGSRLRNISTTQALTAIVDSLT